MHLNRPNVLEIKFIKPQKNVSTIEKYYEKCFSILLFVAKIKLCILSDKSDKIASNFVKLH